MGKKILQISLFSLFLLVGFSCEKDCPDGFSGEDCEIRESDRYVASYEGTINCGPKDEYTTLDIYRESGPFDVKMQLMSPPEFKINASVSADTLFIPQQVIAIPNAQDTSYYIVFDSRGELKGDTLNFTLVLLYPGIPEQEKVYCAYEVMK